MTYTPSTDADRATMLEAVGVASINDLFIDVPREHRDPVLDLPPALPETDVIRHLSTLSAKNLVLENIPSFLGGGFYRHFVPALVDQQLLRSEWYTAYTPYQAEMAQGTLQAMYEFQSLVCDLTGMQVANASLYDGASALAEAVLLCRNLVNRPGVVLADNVHPSYRAVVNTYTRALDVDVRTVSSVRRDKLSLMSDPQAVIDAIDDQTCCVVVQRPDFFGVVENIEPIVAAARRHGARVISVVGDPVSLGLLVPPGDSGVDIVVGEVRSFAGPLAYGGPGAGMFATTSELIRRVPGRIAGRTTDEDGRPGFVLTLQTREQHIRRERATSNITTNEALVALGATITLSALGPRGLRQMAEQCLTAAHRTADALAAVGATLATSGSYFNEFLVHAPDGAGHRLERLRVEQDVIGGLDLGRFYPELDDLILVAATELTTADEVRKFAEGWKATNDG